MTTTAIKIRFPSEAEAERSRQFQVLKNYLAAIDQFIESRYGPPRVQRLETLVLVQRALPSFHAIQRFPMRSPARVKSLLKLAWASEAQLRAHGDPDGTILPYANAWAPVHAYYSCYIASSAFLTASGAADPSDHAATLRAVGSQVIQRRLVPSPWDVTAAGCPHTNTTTWANVPVGVDPTSHIELLANPSLTSFWPRYCKMLETTRERRLETSYESWKKQNGRKIVRRTEKQAIAARFSSTSLFDFLWRLRLRANYRDVESFLTWNVDTAWHRQFHTSILNLTESTCLLLENLILKKCGPETLQQAMDEFAANGGPLAGEVLTPRRTVLHL